MSKSQFMLKIGNKKIKTNVFLAPMSGCTDLSFRLIAREHGAKFCFFEMLDSNSIVYGDNKKTLEMLKTDHLDRPIAAQLLGSDPLIMLKAAIKLLKMVKIAFLDINAACPVKKVTSKKAGAYLLLEPKKLYAIVKTLSSSLPVPVTVKLRTGYGRSDTKEIIKIAKGLEKSGASALFVHGRTRSQLYSGEVDYPAIKAIKENVNIPVFGSGNILSPELAKKMFDETGCDGIMVARGALGNPWIFKRIKNTKTPGPTLKEKIKVLKKHLSYIDKFCDRPSKIGHMRKNAIWYTKNRPDAAEIRRKIGRAKDLYAIMHEIQERSA